MRKGLLSSAKGKLECGKLSKKDFVCKSQIKLKNLSNSVSGTPRGTRERGMTEESQV